MNRSHIHQIIEQADLVVTVVYIFRGFFPVEKSVFSNLKTVRSAFDSHHPNACSMRTVSAEEGLVAEVEDRALESPIELLETL